VERLKFAVEPPEDLLDQRPVVWDHLGQDLPAALGEVEPVGATIVGHGR
jgi:hypothetical protein